MDTTPGLVAASPRFRSNGDDAFFVEREHGRSIGLQRSRRRAAALAGALAIDLEGLRSRAASIIVVVGSKGKGTAATYASATLAAAGMRVGTLTSPGLRSNRERIRVDGSAIAPAAYAALVNRISSTLVEKHGTLPSDGYLAPTGLFTLAAVRHFLDARCDAWVLEAGMGGATDEVSLFAAATVALTPIFAEHLGVLGETVRDIAREKLGVISTETTRILTLPQDHPEAAAALRDADVITRLDVVDRDPVGNVPWPPSLVGANARLGVATALALLNGQSRRVDMQRLRGILGSISLPGRLSVHRRGPQTWVVDAATNQRAAAAALRWTADTVGPPDSVLACIPDGKDAAGVRTALRDISYLPLRTDAPHLEFAQWGRPLPALHEIAAHSLGPRILAFGTVHFVGDVMELLQVDTELAFRAA